MAQWMTCLSAGGVAVVTSLTITWRRKLLYGKQEHSNDALDPSALRVQIEELIEKKVNPECLKVELEPEKFQGVSGAFVR